MRGLFIGTFFVLMPAIAIASAATSTSTSTSDSAATADSAAAAGARVNSASLLTDEELSGGAVLAPPPAIVTSGRGAVNTAMLSALETEAQIRRIELYLKSGPAQSGDLRVVQSSKER